MSSTNPLYSVQAHKDVISDLRLTKNGKTLVSCSYDGSIKIWAFPSCNLVKTITYEYRKGYEEYSKELGFQSIGDHPQTYKLAITPDDKYVIAGCIDQAIRIFELESGRLIDTLLGHALDVQAIALSPDGKYFISGSGNGLSGKNEIKIWDFKTKKVLFELNNVVNVVEDIVITSNGKFFVSGFHNSLELRELPSGNLIISVTTPQLNFVRSIAVSSDNMYVIGGYNDNYVRIWNIKTGDLESLIEEDPSRKNMESDVRLLISPLDAYLITGGYKHINIWAFPSRELVRSHIGDDSFIHSLAISPDWQYLISGSGNGVIKVWEFPEGRVLKKQKAEDEKKIAKIQKLLQISKKLKIDDLARILTIERFQLLEKLVEWSEQFPLQIDGDFVIIDYDNVATLMNTLDRQFKEWDLQKEKKL